jgi:transcriptional regulator with XRE-family HTH domain
MQSSRKGSGSSDERKRRLHAEGDEGRSVMSVLAERFEALRASGTMQLERTAAAEANYLGISASYLSRIRGGKAVITEEFIQKIASRFEPHDEERRRALLTELEAARETMPERALSVAEPDISPNAIIDFFDRIAQPGSLLCVDYRDLPQATSTGPFPQTAVEAAYAVAHGLCFAMFQPFGPVEQLRELLVRALEHSGHDRMFPCIRLYEYIFQLAVRVRQVYTEMHAEVQKHDQPLGQLVLYEAKHVPETLVGCGIQSRVFYVDYTHALRHYSEVYEWVAGENRHYFIHRAGDSLNADAVREQFHPITTHWIAEQRSARPCIPMTNDELDEIEQRLDGSKGLPRSKWRVWNPKAP